jgi:ADP-ribose pyrophosphatase YjhB (NUDIX family)
VTTRPANYCPTCGTAVTTRAFDGRDRAFCPDCDRYVFRNAAPASNVAVVDGERVLLVERGVPPGVGDWTIPGGHLEHDEGPRTGGVRELHEETGLRADPDDLRLLDVQLLPPFREKRVLSICYAVAATDCTGEVAAGTDAVDARFVPAAAVADGDVRCRPHSVSRVPAAVAAVGSD